MRMATSSRQSLPTQRESVGRGVKCECKMHSLRDEKITVLIECTGECLRPPHITHKTNVIIKM
jgi:hypothetical protein